MYLTEETLEEFRMNNKTSPVYNPHRNSYIIEIPEPFIVARKIIQYERRELLRDIQLRGHATCYLVQLSKNIESRIKKSNPFSQQTQIMLRWEAHICQYKLLVNMYESEHLSSFIQFVEKLYV